MAKITIEELSGSLKEYLNGLGLTEAQVQELIDKFEDEKIGDISQLSTAEKGSLVGAINELFQDVDSGKSIIADAIDNINITKDSTFAAMGEAIEEIQANREEDKQMLTEIQTQSNEAKQSLVDMLVAKNINASMDNSWTELTKLLDGTTIINSGDTLIVRGNDTTLVTGPVTSKLAFYTSESVSNTLTVPDLPSGTLHSFKINITVTTYSSSGTWSGASAQRCDLIASIQRTGVKVFTSYFIGNVSSSGTTYSAEIPAKYLQKGDKITYTLTGDTANDNKPGDSIYVSKVTLTYNVISI